MSEHREKLHVVLQYLEGQFAGAAISPHDTPAQDTWGFTIQLPHGRYELRVDGDLLKDRSAAEIAGLLSRWRVHEELCRAEGLPVILTGRGVRLASSN